MVTARNSYAAVLLPNGKVLAAGGSSDGPSAVAAAELYDPATGTWSTTGSMATARHAPAGLLLNGKVLVTGGHSFGALASTELYDPATGTWSTTGSMVTARQVHTATLLPTGKVLVAGGVDATGSALASAEIFSDQPQNKDECKKNGWQGLTRADGTPFKNQGDCIQYVNTGK
jgi:hypothetical protein